MVAITTDNAPALGRRPVPQRVAAPQRPHPAAGGASLLPADTAARVLLLVAAVVAVLVVAVATAGLGRLLDGQRGIPAAAPAVVVQG